MLWFWLLVTLDAVLSFTVSMTSEKKSDLLVAVERTFPDAVGVTVDEEIIQTNAVGYKVSIERGEGSLPQKAFIKRVMVEDYVDKRKDWSDLRRTLLYARTETRFYRDFLPQLVKAGVTGVPEVYDARIDLEGLIPESEPIVTSSMTSHELSELTGQRTNGKGSVLILECVDDDKYFQDSPLSTQQCQRCLEAAASLHASAWNKKDLLEQAQEKLSSGPVFALATRNPKELEGICDAWDHFTKEFHGELQHLLEDPVFCELGPRCQKVAKIVAQEMSPSSDHPHATIIHGDYKAMNVFLPKDSEKDEPVFIDLASIGLGLGMADVAMHIRHAVLPEDLANGGEMDLVRHYYEYLCKQLPDGVEYSWEDAQREYMYASVDYFRFFLGRMWKTATHKTMATKAPNPNIHLINRNINAAVSYCEQIDGLLRIIEQECGFVR